jgi:hypothetical protein
MNPEKMAALAAAGIAVLILLVLVARRLPRRMKSKRFVKKWRALQTKCADESQWPEVLKEADMLLDEALRRKRIKGKTTGERMVEAGKYFSDKESVWFAHKLRKRYEANPRAKLTQEQMKKALLGLLQALKDLGAIK